MREKLLLMTAMVRLRRKNAPIKTDEMKKIMMIMPDVI
jgi:hypothetical protein